MGYVVHHTIICTSFDENSLLEAHKQALNLFPIKLVSPILSSRMNGYNTFYVIPDGSNEYWEVSDDMDVRRERFIDWLYHEKNGGLIDFIEVKYGGDMPQLCQIINYNSSEE